MSGQGQLRQRLQRAQDAYVAAAIALTTTRTTLTATATSSTGDQTMAYHWTDHVVLATHLAACSSSRSFSQRQALP
jgi:hypothetical protein